MIAPRAFATILATSLVAFGVSQQVLNTTLYERSCCALDNKAGPESFVVPVDGVYIVSMRVDHNGQSGWLDPCPCGSHTYVHRARTPPCHFTELSSEYTRHIPVKLRKLWGHVYTSEISG